MVERWERNRLPSKSIVNIFDVYARTNLAGTRARKCKLSGRRVKKSQSDSKDECFWYFLLVFCGGRRIILMVAVLSTED
ncbi:hypothetical protein ACS0PU_003669 [Formica fusca]